MNKINKMTSLLIKLGAFQLNHFINKFAITKKQDFKNNFFYENTGVLSVKQC